MEQSRQMQVHAIVLAGGDGNRFGGEMPKQFVRLAGDPILLRTLRALAAAPIDRLIVVSHPGWVAETEALVEGARITIPVAVVAGGATRNESTRNGLQALEAADDDVVLVHDAVRPLLPLEVILRSIEPVISGRADSTDTVIPSADTLVIVDGEDVVEIPERGRYRRGQTPSRSGRASSRRPTRRRHGSGTFGDGRLQPRPPPCAGRPDRRGRRRRGERQDHDHIDMSSVLGCSRCAC